MLSYFKKIVRESSGVLIACTVITMVCGIALSESDELLSAIPFLVLIMPAQNDVVGDMCQVLVGRLASHLYIGLVPARLSFTPRVRYDFQSLFVALLLSVSTLLAVNVIVATISGIEFGNFYKIIFVVFTAATLLFSIMFIVLFTGAIYIFKHNKDPNNFLIPITTSLIDTLSPIFVVLLASIVL
ncbi:MAG: magnesium transporter [Candidatus Sigynarchaeota archaeon]